MAHTSCVARLRIPSQITGQILPIKQFELGVCEDFGRRPGDQGPHNLDLALTERRQRLRIV